MNPTENQPSGIWKNVGHSLFIIFDIQKPIGSLFYLEFAGKNCYSADSPLAALLITASEPYTISCEKIEQVYREVIPDLLQIINETI